MEQNSILSELFKPIYRDILPSILKSCKYVDVFNLKSCNKYLNSMVIKHCYVKIAGQVYISGQKFGWNGEKTKYYTEEHIDERSIAYKRFVGPCLETVRKYNDGTVMTFCSDSDSCVFMNKTKNSFKNVKYINQESGDGVKTIITKEYIITYKPIERGKYVILLENIDGNSNVYTSQGILLMCCGVTRDITCFKDTKHDSEFIRKILARCFENPSLTNVSLLIDYICVYFREYL